PLRPVRASTPPCCCRPYTSRVPSRNPEFDRSHRLRTGLVVVAPLVGARGLAELCTPLEELRDVVWKLLPCMWMVITSAVRLAPPGIESSRARASAPAAAIAGDGPGERLPEGRALAAHPPLRQLRERLAA